MVPRKRRVRGPGAVLLGSDRLTPSRQRAACCAARSTDRRAPSGRRAWSRATSPPASASRGTAAASCCGRGRARPRGSSRAPRRGPRHAGWPLCRSPSAREDGRLLGAFGEGDGRLLLALGLGDRRPPGALGRHLTGHRLEHARGRVDLAHLDGGHLHAPALGHLVEADAKRGVHVLALRQARRRGACRRRRCAASSRRRSGPPPRSAARCSTDIDGSTTL